MKPHFTKHWQGEESSVQPDIQLILLQWLKFPQRRTPAIGSKEASPYSHSYLDPSEIDINYLYTIIQQKQKI